MRLELGDARTKYAELFLFYPHYLRRRITHDARAVISSAVLADSAPCFAVGFLLGSIATYLLVHIKCTASTRAAEERAEPSVRCEQVRLNTGRDPSVQVLSYIHACMHIP